ncbi:MAG: MBL fold metallo-hydrolase [Phycisphaerales bacterium]|nr:MBL fold metallo-hydrolase [Phycisphaerales bacterium]
MRAVRVTFLGTGTSHGIPMIGCTCAVCHSMNPRDRRTRSSVLVQAGGYSILIDTTPELRLQCIACGVCQVDAVLFTHHHADHIVGLDDLRRFNELHDTTLTCYCNSTTSTVLERMFGYAFQEKPGYLSAKPRLSKTLIEGPFELLGICVTPIALMHGKLQILGFRIGRFAYCTDCNAIPIESMALMDGLDVLVLDALRRRPHPTHFNLEQAVEIAGRIGAKQTYFTHIAHELPHEATNAELPQSMALAYDGQIFECE